MALSISTCFGTVALVHVLSNRGQYVCAAHTTMAPSALARPALHTTLEATGCVPTACAALILFSARILHGTVRCRAVESSSQAAAQSCIDKYVNFLRSNGCERFLKVLKVHKSAKSQPYRRQTRGPSCQMGQGGAYYLCLHPVL